MSNLKILCIMEDKELYWRDTLSWHSEPWSFSKQIWPTKRKQHALVIILWKTWLFLPLETHLSPGLMGSRVRVWETERSQCEAKLRNYASSIPRRDLLSNTNDSLFSFLFSKIQCLSPCSQYIFTMLSFFSRLSSVEHSFWVRLQ